MAFSFSPTSIQSYFEYSCPARWDFGRKWRLNKHNELLQWGIDTHALLESGEKITSVAGGDKPHYMAARIQAEMISLGVKVDPAYIEFAEKIPLTHLGTEMTLSRRIDGVATLPDGRKIIIDYKVTGGGWKDHGGVTPKSQNFQSAAYIIPGSKEVEKWWPKEVWYFTIGAYNGRMKVVRYTPTPSDVTNLLDAAYVFMKAMETKLHPKVRGNHCGGDYPCDYFALCFAKDKREMTAAQKLYTKVPPRN